ncbi:tetratricopeptide repeat protein, partial [Limnospira sp. PMC 1042.18]|uniref:tetratricopeptide repeat protein n=1 Tax=Limnospira sp. PMC 1042.18 TaxID=2981018 RepID=UPI0028E11676
MYAALRAKQTAQDNYQPALPLYRSVEDRGGEATTLNNIGREYSDLGDKQTPLYYLNQALPILRAVV